MLPLSLCGATHQSIVDTIMSCDVKVVNMNASEFANVYDKWQSIDVPNKTVFVYLCTEPVEYSNGDDTENTHIRYFNVLSGIDTASLHGLFQNSNVEHLDAYGSIYVKDAKCSILSNSYANAEEILSPDGYCEVLALATVSDAYYIRFTYIAYSFREERLVIREDRAFGIDGPKIEKDALGGKCAFQWNANELHVRINDLKLFNKIDKSNRLTRKRNQLYGIAVMRFETDMILIVGDSLEDWSDEGHGKSQGFVVHTKQSIENAATSYALTDKKYGFSNWCSEEGDASMPNDMIQTLLDEGLYTLLSQWRAADCEMLNHAKPELLADIVIALVNKHTGAGWVKTRPATDEDIEKGEMLFMGQYLVNVLLPEYRKTPTLFGYGLF